MSMSESNEQTKQDSANTRTAAKARRTTAKATAPATKAANKAADKANDAASAGTEAAERTAGTLSGAAQTAAKSVEAGRQTVVAASGQAAAVAKTAWTVIAQRKLIAAGVGAGLTALTATSYAVGRRSGRHTHGPITRLTGGRI
ncbi:membrane protein involved in colicin uptake [Streptomyces canus]|uniref:hypothetical protein n=1 Tax=unclassified Streptomyces TaxID=2593676 RepID=UPI000F653739|nr:hypothetical protein [Streptomyces sp. RP5T]RRR79719.1 hypothetical protein EHS43_23135 [Streptomyces sp. RP5T]